MPAVVTLALGKRLGAVGLSRFAHLGKWLRAAELICFAQKACLGKFNTHRHNCQRWAAACPNKKKTWAHTNPMSIDEIKKLPINFYKCGIAGWCMEVVFTSVESIMIGDWRLMGRTSLIMFPIYGLGALLRPIGRLVDRWLGCECLRRPDQAIRHGMVYMVLIFLVEYVCGVWLKTKGICPWDYSASQSSIHGVIRLDFAPLWFGAGLLFEEITKKGSG